MSMFTCNHCYELIDGDWDGCEADPRDPCELVCTSCHELISPEEDSCVALEGFGD